MRALSISAAWEESRAILVRDGQLFIAVALALIAFPSAVNGLVNPRGAVGAAIPLWINVVTVLTSVVTFAGQLALIRLALGPSISVGEAIAHGLRRLPIYFVALLIVVGSLFVIAIVLGIGLAAVGVSVPSNGVRPGLGLIVASLFYVALVCFVFVRMALVAPIASAEPAGPIATIRRSWSVTAGHWWPLFAFVLIFGVSTLIIFIAVGSAVGVVVGLLLGSIQPMSAGALIVALVQALISSAIGTLLAVMLARIYLQLSSKAE